MARTPIDARLALAALCLLTAAAGHAVRAQASRPTSRHVSLGPEGALVYGATRSGDRVPDFSHAGYMGGGVALPSVPVRITVRPGEGDDTARIQAAIDELASRPRDTDGFRGAVRLAAGRYEVGGPLRIAASGIVLRGQGHGEDGTVLLATGTEQRTVLHVGGEGQPKELAATRRAVIDEYVPVGATRLRLESADGLSVGDEVLVWRLSNERWIDELGMNRIPPRDDGRPVHQWEPETYRLPFDRIITAIEGRTITLDAPLTTAIDQQYGGGYVVKHEYPRRIEQVGVENLRAVSEYRGPMDEDEDHAWVFIEMDALQDGWVRDVTAAHFGFSLVTVGRQTKRVTVQDSRCLDPVSRITGSRRYSFYVLGQLTLVQRCYARHGRHDFVLGSRVQGPNVFLDCVAEEAHNDTGPHHRWSSGCLFDNVVVRGDAINVRNRLNLGTGHGWAGANMVLWNCRADLITCERPPTAQNWAIGCVAESYRGDGLWESRGRPVKPESLYRAQLAERLGPEAVERAAAPWSEGNQKQFDTPR